ncbi:MAG: LacI family DNA-binding transcriptional regulator [Verrucomicrobiota bacterium]
MKIQRVSLDHIAKLAGVHKATISRALRNHPTIPKSTRDRIHDIARKEGYRPNPLVAMYQAQTRSSRPTTMQATLGWLNDYPNPSSWNEFPWLRGYLAGARQRCADMGYRLEEINLSLSNGNSYEKEVKRVGKLLRAGGIYGIILPLMLNYQYLLAKWENCVVSLIGTGHLRPPTGSEGFQAQFYPQGFPLAGRDLYFNMRLAFQKLLQLGYTRIGLVYSHYLDAEANSLAQAAYLVEQAQLPKSERIPILFLERFKEGRPVAFDHWLEKNKPEAILCISPVVRDWVEELGHKVPEDIGLANLNLVADVSGWGGINEQHEEIGASAVDILIGALSRNELGLPGKPRKVLIPGEWIPGSTLRGHESRQDASAMVRR